MLTTIVSVPQSLKDGSSRGLLGVFDGNMLNDFTLRNGTQINPDDSGKFTTEQAFQFGQDCKLVYLQKLQKTTKE